KKQSRYPPHRYKNESVGPFREGNTIGSSGWEERAFSWPLRETNKSHPESWETPKRGARQLFLPTRGPNGRPLSPGKWPRKGLPCHRWGKTDGPRFCWPRKDFWSLG